MTFRFSAPACLAGITVLFCATTTWAQAPVGAERIIAAETRVAALEAQNQQYKNTIATQTAALKRLDQEISLAQQELVLQREKDSQARRVLQERIAELRTQAQDQARAMQALQQEANRLRAEQAQAQAALSDAEDALVGAEQARGEQLQAAAENQRQLQADLQRTKQQLAYVLERNQTLQQALSETTSSSEMNALQQANQELNSQLAILQDRNGELQQALAARSEQGMANNSRLQTEYAALQQEYNAALDGIRSCEARLRSQQDAATSSDTGNARVAELENALARANSEIRSLNESHQRELQTERAMAAGSEAALEAQYQQQIAQLQQALKTCQ